MKRIISLFLILALSLTLITSCKSKDDGKDKNKDKGNDSIITDENNNSDKYTLEGMKTHLEEVIPGGKNFKAVDVSQGYPASVKAAFTCDEGCAVIVSATGYKEGLVIMCGVGPDGKITGVKHLESNEAYGLENELNSAYVGDSLDSVELIIASGATESSRTSKGYYDAMRVALEIATEIRFLGDSLPLFNMFDNDLSAYVDISEDIYKGYKVTVDLDMLNLKVGNGIAQLLYQHRNTDNPTNVEDATIGVGDSVSLYYRGYTIGEDGAKNYFDGGCNFNSSKAHVLGIGSGSFIDGFEYNLIGKNASDYATLEKISEKGANVSSEDIVLVSYSLARKDGTTVSTQKAMIDLADPNVDKIWGAGFAEYWQTHDVAVGTEIQIITDENDVYFITVSEIYRVDDGVKPVLEIETYFPEGYQEPSLSGKTAYFEVFITGVQRYEVPEFDDRFITETLKMTASDLSEFDGETLAEKYKNKIRKDLIDEIVTDVFFTDVISKATVIKLPEKLIKEAYNSMVSELKYYYQYYYYYYYYPTFDDFCTAYFGTAYWRTEILTSAKSSASRQLAFYRIMYKESLKPTADEYERLFDEYLVETLEGRNITPDKYATEEEYLNAKTTLKNQLYESYGEEYFESLIYYGIVIDAVVEYANLEFI